MSREAGGRTYERGPQASDPLEDLIKSVVAGVVEQLAKALRGSLQEAVGQALAESIHEVTRGFVEGSMPAPASDTGSRIPIDLVPMGRSTASDCDTRTNATAPAAPEETQVARGTVRMTRRRAASPASGAHGDTLPFPDTPSEEPVADSVSTTPAARPWPRVLERLEGLRAGLDALGVSSATDAECMAGMLRQLEVGHRQSRAAGRQQARSA